MADVFSNGNRGLLVGAGILTWMFALMGTFQSRGLAAPPRPAPANPPALSESINEDSAVDETTSNDSEMVTELVIKSRKRRAPISEPEPIAQVQAARVESPKHLVWFESERDVGVCKIKWVGGSKIANLHAETRLPEGTVDFSYICGTHRGRASIEVEPESVNGVLFCADRDDVRIETVRSKRDRCRRR